MNPVEIGFLGIAILVMLVLVGINVGFALILTGFIGILLVGGTQAALSSLSLHTFATVNNNIFAVIPLFILMGTFISYSGIGGDIYLTTRTWFGRVKGGLAMATVGACGLFAACTGSSMAGAVTMGKIAYPEMRKLGYDPGLSIGCAAAGGTLGILIPPSMGFILIGILAEVSIGKLFMAGIIPGILEILFYCGTIYVLCLINPALGPGASSTTMREKFKTIKHLWPIFFLFILIMGGIYGGMITPYEAGGIGAFGALIICLIMKRLNRSTFNKALVDTTTLTAMIIILVIGSFLFNGFLAIARIPYVISEFVVSLDINRYLILIMIVCFYILMGMVFDIFAILIITIPIFYPPVLALGFDPIWFGVILVRVSEIGLITPPFGINLFAIASTVDAPIATIYKGVFPFIIADIINVALLIAIPQFSTFIPGIMK